MSNAVLALVLTSAVLLTNIPFIKSAFTYKHENPVFVRTKRSATLTLCAISWGIGLWGVYMFMSPPNPWFVPFAVVYASMAGLFGVIALVIRLRPVHATQSV